MFVACSIASVTAIFGINVHFSLDIPDSTGQYKGMMKHNTKRSHVTRATIANVNVEEIAERILQHNAFWNDPNYIPGDNDKGRSVLEIAATLYASTGVFDGKIEQGVTIETTARWGTFALFILGILEDSAEDSAYIVEDGQRAFLLLESGELEDL